jgi:hypothetical protein
MSRFLFAIPIALSAACTNPLAPPLTLGGVWSGYRGTADGYVLTVVQQGTSLSGKGGSRGELRLSVDSFTVSGIYRLPEVHMQFTDARGVLVDFSGTARGPALGGIDALTGDSVIFSRD